MPTYRTHAERIGDIVRRDTADFEFLPDRGRIGGASLSSGVFRERKTGLEWLGKCHSLLSRDDQQARQGNIDQEKTTWAWVDIFTPTKYMSLNPASFNS